MLKLQRAVGLLALTALVTGVANADNMSLANSNVLGTADGLPPSKENVCSNETGAAYGLCSAFCEAMDCDSLTPRASKIACNRIKIRFQKQTGSEPPCLQTCICNTALTGFLDAVDSGITACLDDPAIGFVALFTSEGLVPASQATPDASVCGFAFDTGPILTVTEDEAVLCNDFLRARAEEVGVVCGSLP